MATVYDVAEYILSTQGEMSAMKLHKLCYYCQGWHLVWEGTPLFGERIEAWANGPVIPALYELHRGAFLVAPGDIHAALAERRHADRRASARARRRVLTRWALAAFLLIAAPFAARAVVRGAGAKPR